MKGIEYLRNKLAIKRTRVLTRYRFYEQKESRLDFGDLIPADMALKYDTILGWCTKSVDCLADRMQFNGFKDDNYDFEGIFNLNNPDVFFDSAINSALISSCCFIYISDDGTGFPRLQVIDGANATGIIDPITGLLSEGYAVLKRDSDTDSVLIEAYFVAGETLVIDREAHSQTTFFNNVPYPTLVPIINRPDAKRPFGHSRISRACMNLQNKARMVLTRADVTAEFYSYPQKYVLGLNNDAEFDSKKASISTFLSLGEDEDGNTPKVGQFTQQNMEPHVNQFRTLASVFGGETGLTLDDLGFATENPSSADAIKAAHESLRLTATKAEKTFGSGFINVGYVASCLRDNFAYRRNQFYMTKPQWKPLFEADSSQMAGFGDAIGKVNQAIPGYFGKENVSQMIGIESGSDETAVPIVPAPGSEAK